MCEGFSLDDVLALDAAHIAEYGFINIGVDVEPPATPWAYTVGLLDAAGHPELIVVGAPLARCGPILATLGSRCSTTTSGSMSATVSISAGATR